jgi:hypothetical protein
VSLAQVSIEITDSVLKTATCSGKIHGSLTSTAEELELPDEAMGVSPTMGRKVRVSLVSTTEELEIPGEITVVPTDVDEV